MVAGWVYHQQGVEDLHHTIQFLATCGLRVYTQLIDHSRRRTYNRSHRQKGSATLNFELPGVSGDNFNSKTNSCSDWTEKRLSFVFKMDLLKVFFAVDRGWKADSHSLQDLFKQSSVSRGCLSPQPVWCGVVWCGVVWCGVVWSGVVWCGVVWWGVVWWGEVWCGEVWWGVVRWGVVRWGEVRWGVVRWGEVRWGEVRWGEVWHRTIRLNIQNQSCCSRQPRPKGKRQWLKRISRGTVSYTCMNFKTNSKNTVWK